MNTKENLQNTYFDIRTDQVEEFREVIAEIEKIIEDGKVTEDAMRRLENCCDSLGSLHRNFLWRMLKLTKQNHMID
jgi:diphthamide synthase (EF-2-diphthine--ammonia ligase)